MKNWKRRYFVLDENSLNYYKTDMVRKRRRAQTRWRQCKDASRCSQTDTEEEESEKNLCLLQNLLRVSTCRGMRPEYLLMSSTCGQTTACLCTYMGTPRVCVRTYVCLAECSHLFMCNHVLSACSCCRGFVLQLKAEEGKFVSGDGEARAEAGLSDPSHEHLPYSCRIRIHAGGFW